MIIDNIKNSNEYVTIHKDFGKIFEFLENLKEDATGMVTLDEGNVWANVFGVEKLPDDMKIFEAHRKFIDIHYILSGEESFAYSNIDRLKSVMSYNDADDYELFEGESGNCILLKKGDFVITFPQDAHIPDFQIDDSQKTVRVVVKVRM